MSDDDTTGTLKLKLRATTDPYRGGNLRGRRLAEETLGQLSGGASHTALSYTKAWSAPPAGTYYLTLWITETTSQGGTTSGTT